MKKTGGTLLILAAAFLPALIGACKTTPQPVAVRDYIHERLKQLVFSEPTAADLLPKTVGQTRAVRDSETLGHMVKGNIGAILFDDGSRYEVEPLSNDLRATRWLPDEIPPEDQKVLTWFVDRNAGIAVDVLSAGGGSVGAKSAVQVDYLRVGQYKIDPDFDYMAAAALWSIHNRAFRGLPGFETATAANRWIITGAVVNKLVASEFTEWDFKGNVSGQLIGVGGSIYFKNNASSGTYKYRSQYIVTPLEAAARAGYKTALDSVDPETLAAAMRPETPAETQRMAAFFKLAAGGEAQVVLSRLAKDPGLLAKIKTIPWESAPKDYDIGLAFALQPSDKIREFSASSLGMDSTPRGIQAADLRKFELWRGTSGAELLRTLPKP